MVVAITMTNATVIINFLFFSFICKHIAKAMTPLTIPEYQQTFSSFEFIGKGFLMILYTKGRIYTMIALMNGMTASIKNPMPTAAPVLSTDNVEAPK